MFLDKLLCCIHIYGGQPARGLEIRTVKVYNTVYTQRNVYILGGEAVFITLYDKNLSKRDNIEFIMRFLPSKVGKILVKYLVFVRLFVKALLVDKRNDDYLFTTLKEAFTRR